MEPITEQLDLPEGYGNPDKTLGWEEVRKELEAAQTYWVTSVRPNGRPHIVPRDGIWLDDSWYYGGSPTTIHNRNVERNPAVVMHIGDGLKAIIVEGNSVYIYPQLEIAELLSEINNSKYAHYGMKTSAETYTERGTWALKARRILAWTNLPENATRFRFTPE